MANEGIGTKDNITQSLHKPCKNNKEYPYPLEIQQTNEGKGEVLLRKSPLDP